RQIVQDVVGLGEELPVITLEPEVEQLLLQSLQKEAASPGLEPSLTERLQAQVAQAAAQQDSIGEPSVLLVPPPLRMPLARLLRSAVPQLHVLAWNEIPETRRVRLVTTIGKS
ncbi:MAG: FHIPEP family type III secretion protein, partial [Gammaproteobacteria bacterium]|nr:FHIPEP family type III secretion protein [Gammaproteobacteria bacterium]